MSRPSRSTFFYPILFSLLLQYPFSSSVISQGRFLENGEPIIKGPDGGMFLDTPTRTKVDLSGNWTYSLGGKSWYPVKVPSAYDFVDKVTFIRSFDIPPELIDRSAFKLVAYGINYDCEISVNDIFIGRHVGGYTSFVFPIPENALQVGKNNVVKIVVNNALNARSTIPLRQQVWGWRNYGGIFRDIYLLATPRVWIEDVQVHTSLSPDFKTATFQVDGTVDNDLAEYGRKDTTESAMLLSSSYRLWVGLYDEFSGTLVAKSQEEKFTIAKRKTTKVECGIRLSRPKLWDPENHQLYLLKVYAMREKALYDEMDFRVGVRDISTKGTDVFLNGKGIFLQGVLWREDHPKYGSAMTREALEKDVQLIKSLGANVVRVGNHPPHPYFMSLCDRYGLLVMEEVPVWDVPSDVLGEEYYQELAKTYAREMILRDRNHACVLAWGLGDDFDSSEKESREYVRVVKGLVRSLDDRPTYYVTSLVNNDVAANEVDIAAVNIMTSSMKQFKSKLEEWKQKHAHQPVIVGRFGKVVDPENHNGYSDPMSLESQARYLIQHFGVVKEVRIAGGIIDGFADWRGDRPIMTLEHSDRFLSTMGLVSFAREKRPAFDKVRALFNNEKIAALTMGTYSENAPIIFVVFGFLLLLGFAYLLKSHRRFRESVFRSFLRPYNFFADIRDQRILSYFQTIALGIATAFTLALVTASFFYHYRDSGNMDYVLTHFLLSDAVKASFSELVWHPFKSILVFTVLFAALLVLLVAFVKIFSFFVQTKVYFFHAYSVSTWAGLPIVLLIPVGMVMYRVMESESFVLPIVLLLVAIGVWVLIRLLKAISIVYDVTPLRVYAGGVLVLLVVLGAVLIYYDYTQSTLAYYKFFVNYIQGTS
jgi:beta-galactosidase